MSILVPDYDIYAGQIKNVENVNTFLSYVDESLWVGGTFSGRLTENDSVGLSIYYTARNLTRSANDKVETDNGTNAVLTSEEKNLTTNSIVPILGFHRKLTENWSLGVSYRTPSLPISGEGSYYRSVTETTPYTNTVLNRGDLRAITRIPARLSIGAAREIKKFNTVSFDVQIYEGISYQDLPEVPEGTDLIDHKSVTNFSVGYEQYIEESVTLRLGAYTNKSSHDTPVTSKGARQGDSIDMWGFSANLNFRTPQRTFFTFGGYYNGGDGFSTQLVNQKIVTIPKSQQIFTMLVATGFDF
jgi:long-subunit fatty acid transport protein